MMEQIKVLRAWLQRMWQKWRAFGLVLAAGVCLIAFGGIQARPKTAEQAPQGFSLDAFQAQLEMQLSQIEHVGQTSLLLTLDQTGETVFAEEVRRTSSEGLEQSFESGLILVSESGYGQTPVTVTQRLPTFRGAVVLCDGASDPVVQLAVMKAVSTACGIGTDKIAVLKRAAEA